MRKHNEYRLLRLRYSDCIEQRKHFLRQGERKLQLVLTNKLLLLPVPAQVLAEVMLWNSPRVEQG